MKNSYLFRILLAGFIAAAGCWVFYKILLYSNYQYFKAPEKTQELFTGNTNYDILFLGSSRMMNHVNPRIIDSILLVNSFNGGQNACTLIESNLILKNYLASHSKPKVVVLGIDLFSMNTSDRKLGFYPTYLPYMKNKEVGRVLKAEGVNTKLLTVFPFFRPIEYDDYYKSAILKVALNKRELENSEFYYKGYESNSNEVLDHNALRISKPYRMQVDGVAVNSLKEIAATCKSNNINLVFNYAPEYNGVNSRSIINADSIFSIYSSIATEYSIPFYRDDTLRISSDASLFRNPGHLNTKGAEIYSSLIADRLRRFM